MKKIVLLIFCLGAFSILQAQDVYVSSVGDDSNTGTESSPFLSVGRAVESVAGNSSGKTIWINGGVYHISSTMALSSDHSGLTIRAMPGEKVYFTGGKAIPGHYFKTLTDVAVLEGIPDVAHGKVMCAELSSEYSGVFPTKSSYNKSGAISWNGYLLNVAQYPNKGYAFVDNILYEGTTDKNLPYSESNPIGAEFTTNEALNWSMLTAEFDRTKDMLIDGYWNNDWFFHNDRIGALNSSRKSIKLLRYTRELLDDHIRFPRRFRIKNALCQLDQPGEWYFDKTNNKLYIWPVQPPNSQTPLTILDNTKFFDGTGIQNLTIRDITFQNFGDLAIKIAESENILVAGCTFRSSPGMAMRIGGTSNGIQSCDFYNIHQAFVLTGVVGKIDGLNEHTNRVTLTPENNFARNNHMHHCTFIGYGYASIQGVGVDFSNNLIHDMNGAVKFSDVNDMVIQKNEFYNMGYELGDWNPIYGNDDFALRGNVIKNNFFHHLMEVAGTHGIAALRQDGDATGYHVESNIMYKTGRSAVAFSGADNAVRNNVVMETSFVWSTRQSPYDAYPRATWKTKPEWMDTICKRVAEYQELPKGHLYNRLGNAERIFGTRGWETNELWKSKYPNLEFSCEPCIAEESPYNNAYTTITQNYTSGASSLPYHLHGGNTINNFDDIKWMLPNSSTIDMPANFDPDTVFTDPDILDFSFLDDFDPVPGFEKWAFDEVGLYVDEYRRITPDKNEYRSKIKAKYQGVKSSGNPYDPGSHNNIYEDPEYLKLVSDIATVALAPVAVFPFDEEEGGRAYDIINNQKAVWQNADTSLLTWQPGQIEYSASVGGSASEYFTLSSDSLNGATAFTLCAWVKASNVSTNNTLLSTGNAGNYWGVSIENGKLKGFWNGVELESSTDLSSDIWYFIVATWANDGSIKLYVDGEMVADGTNGPLSYASTGSWTFSAKPGGIDVFSGSLDELSMFKYQLTQNEIDLLFQSGSNGLPISILIPIEAISMNVNPKTLKVRSRFSGFLKTTVAPSNAFDQSIDWISLDETVATIDDMGMLQVKGEGQVKIVANLNNSSLTDTCEIDVLPDSELLIREPVAYWPHDESGGSIAYDLIGGENAVWRDAVDPVRGEGKFGNATYFNAGQNDTYVVNGDPLKDAKSLSISIWFKVNRLYQYKGLVSTRKPSDGSNNWGLAAASDKVDARIGGKSGYADPYIVPGRWINTIVTWDTSGERKLYLDGKLVKEDLLEIKSYESNDIWYFGDDVCCKNRELDGQLDDIAMFDTVLTQEEVTQINLMGSFGSSIKNMIAQFTQGVSVNTDVLSLAIGEENLVTATVTPENATDKTVKWKSLNESVATVDFSGLITAKDEGDTDIIVTTLDGGFTDTIAVSVYRIYPDRVTLNSTELTIKEGQTIELIAEVLPENTTDKALLWASENTAVAEVNAYGYVKGIKEGLTNITATTVYGNKVAICMVEVKYVHVDSIVISHSELNMEIEDTLTIYAELYPVDAQNKLMAWTSDNSEVAIVSSSGLVEAVSNGVTQIVAYSWDEGKTSECVVRVGQANTISEINKNSISLFPNPAQDFVNISGLPLNVQQIVIYSIDGRLIKQLEPGSLDESEPVKVNVSDWNQGVYLINISVQDEQDIIVNFIK